MTNVLLSLESETLRFSIAARSRRAGFGGAVPRGNLEVSSRSNIKVSTAVGDLNGFGLREQTDYRFTLASKSAAEVRIETRDRAFLADLQFVGSKSALSGYVNFGSKVGAIDLRLIGETETVDLTLEVFPTKLDYAKDFPELLDSLTKRKQNLALRYFSATYRSAGLMRNPGDDQTPSSWISILRAVMDDLEEGFSAIRRRPVELLAPDRALVKAERVQGSSATLRRAIARGRGRGGWQTPPSGPSVRDLIPAEPRQVSLDTPEHRWLAAELDGVLANMGKYLDFSRAEREKSVRPGALVDLTQEIRSMGERISRMRGSYPLDSIPRNGAYPMPTIALRRRAGYSQAFRAINSLKMVVDVAGAGVRASLADLATLYEVWCFFEVVEIVIDTFDDLTSDPSQFRVDDGLFGAILSREQMSVEFNAGGVAFEISYNRPFVSLTGEHRPDISIRVKVPGLPPLMILLDAKYRQEWSKRHGVGPGPGADALNAMHRYRDAVSLDMGGSREILRPTVKAVALFPAASTDTTGYETHDLHRSISSIGVGALPFLPSNRSYVRDWLRSSLTNLIDSVELSGPTTTREAWAFVANVRAEKLHGEVEEVASGAPMPHRLHAFDWAHVRDPNSDSSALASADEPHAHPSWPAASLAKK